MLTAANPLHPEGVTVRSALSSVGVFGPVFIDGTVTSDVCPTLLSDEFVPFLMICVIPMNSAGFKKVVPDLTPTIQYFTLLKTFSRQSCRASVLGNPRKDFSWSPPTPDLKHRDYV
jgi:hypothetical protein